MDPFQHRPARDLTTEKELDIIQGLLDEPQTREG